MPTPALLATEAKPHPVSTLTGVFDTLLGDIVSGRYASGSHLPGERDLARSLGASRPTLREALRRLGAWGLIEARRGSGVVVRDLQDWSLDVLPAYLRLGAGAQRPMTLVLLVRDLLDLRSALIMDVLKLVAPRLRPGSLVRSREAAQRAWAARSDLGAFVRADFEMVRTVAMAGRCLPALWTLNSMTGVYLELARTLTGAANPPDDYLDSWTAILDALENKNPDEAVRRISAYFENHDRRLLAALGVTR